MNNNEVDDRCAFGTMLGWLEAHRGVPLNNEAIEEATYILAQVIIEAKRQVINHFELEEKARGKALAMISLRRASAARDEKPS